MYKKNIFEQTQKYLSVLIISLSFYFYEKNIP